jgi:hypothetical protein
VSVLSGLCSLLRVPLFWKIIHSVYFFEPFLWFLLRRSVHLSCCVLISSKYSVYLTCSFIGRVAVWVRLRKSDSTGTTEEYQHQDVRERTPEVGPLSFAAKLRFLFESRAQEFPCCVVNCVEFNFSVYVIQCIFDACSSVCLVYLCVGGLMYPLAHLSSVRISLIILASHCRPVQHRGTLGCIPLPCLRYFQINRSHIGRQNSFRTTSIAHPQFRHGF